MRHAFVPSLLLAWQIESPQESAPQLPARGLPPHAPLHLEEGHFIEDG